MKRIQHIHAKLMAMYALDAANTKEPWTMWQRRQGVDEFVDLISPSTWNTNFDYRRKLTSFVINGVEVPEPMRELPEVGDTYWLISVRSKPTSRKWEGNYKELARLHLGVMHLTENAAIAHSNALLSFTRI